MTHDELIKEIFKTLIDRGCYPNKLSWMTNLAMVLSQRMGRKISRISLYHALCGAADRRGPTYQAILNELYILLASGETPLDRIIHNKNHSATGI